MAMTRASTKSPALRVASPTLSEEMKSSLPTPKSTGRCLRSSRMSRDTSLMRRRAGTFAQLKLRLTRQTRHKKTSLKIWRALQIMSCTVTCSVIFLIRRARTMITSPRCPQSSVNMETKGRLAQSMQIMRSTKAVQMRKTMISKNKSAHHSRRQALRLRIDSSTSRHAV